MIPRTALMAQEVAAQFTPTQLDDYGNIIINGYATTGPNITGKLAWGWADSPMGPPVPLPTVTSVNPVLEGWTTNYMEYYTQLPPNAYNELPGNPTMYNYTVHSDVGPTPAANNTITSVTIGSAGSGYTPGTYSNILLTGGTGTGARATIVVDAPSGGVIQTLGAPTPGSGYTPGTYTNIPLTGGAGTGATGTVLSLIHI